ncbi:ABC transporter substrate-binding protein [Alicyclobacillus sendaiensis]|uniref:ABC transporter substrate-binding protein n=1 Tax=Alicyclobacillus sendaiensis PA2 TaxID=3029425 RepID=A0ABT6XX99_ALISE|nr:ABC transporter substrate-binding protein [Alicyclobacillus sendaiensis]MDI9259723.1 ABC transporter substrate-binding protein [Alicyclobacillus sendaiensis PA2]
MRRAKWWLLGTSAVVVLGAAGCGTAANATSSGSAKPATGSEAAVGAANDTLTVITSPKGNFADNFNPFDPSTNDGTYGNIYETLFYFDNLTGKTWELLGTSYRFTNGGKSLIVQLRTDAKWTDGTPFTANDVVFTFNELKKYPDADTNNIWSELAGVRALNPHEVEFTFKSVDIPFAEQYVLGGTYIVPEHEWSSLGDPTKVKITWQKAIGTGPFKLISFSPQQYTFEANRFYYSGVPKVKYVRYPAYTSNQGADLALASGQVDWAGIDIPDIQKTFVAADPAHHHYDFPPGGVVELYPNFDNPLLANLAVRQAINLAINRKAIQQIGETDYSVLPVPTSLIPSQMSWLDPNLPSQDRQFTVNDAKAIQILEKAGFKRNSRGIFEKDGKELSFNLLTVSGWSDWDEDALLIKQELQPIGININVVQEQFNAYFNSINPGVGIKPNYDLALSWTNEGPTPYTIYYDMLDSKGNWNIEQYRNPQVDEALRQFASTTNPAVERQALYQVERIAAEDLPVIPVFDGELWYEYNDAHFTGWPTKQNMWINPAPYTFQAAAIIMDHLKPVS